MKLKTKKRIAKEIIILLSGFLLSLIIFLLVYPYNWIYESKAKKIQVSIISKKSQADSLDFAYISKLKERNWFFTEESKIFDSDSTVDILWAGLEKIIDNDSLEYKYKNTWNEDQLIFLNKLGFTNATNFKNFISNNRLTETEKVNYKKANIIRKEMVKLIDNKENFEQKLLTFEEQTNIGLKAFILIIIISYPLRFLYLLVIWSFKILRQKENN